MDSSNPGALAAMGIVPLTIGLAILVFVIFMWFTIFKKSGNSGWLALLLCVPLVNFIVIIWFAFSEWPIQKKLKELGGSM